MESHRRHLDVGCGPGTLIGLLDHRFISTGIDICRPEIDYARREHESESKRFFALPAQALPDECRDYDVATIVEVIEHLPPAELDGVLRTTMERLRRGGKLVVTTPNFHSAWPLVEMLVDHLGELNYAPQTSTGSRPPACGSCSRTSGWRTCASSHTSPSLRSSHRSGDHQARLARLDVRSPRPVELIEHVRPGPAGDPAMGAP